LEELNAEAQVYILDTHDILSHNKTSKKKMFEWRSIAIDEAKPHRPS